MIYKSHSILIFLGGLFSSFLLIVSLRVLSSAILINGRGSPIILVNGASGISIDGSSDISIDEIGYDGLLERVIL